MVRFVFVRHGQSIANINGIFAGNFDVDLSTYGHRQAAMTGEYISRNFNIDKIYSSDLLRAYHTAEHISEYTGVDIIKDKGLREIFAGKWEGLSFSECKTKYADDYNIWLTDIGNAVCTGGESVRELGNRVSATLSEIAGENEGKTILISTHATPIRVIECIWCGIPFCGMRNIKWVSNASITVADYNDGRAEFTVRSEDSFLDNMVSVLPKDV